MFHAEEEFYEYVLYCTVLYFDISDNLFYMTLTELQQGHDTSFEELGCLYTGRIRVSLYWQNWC